MVFAFTFAMNAQAKPLKFGHINTQELMSALPEMEAAITKLETMNTNNNELLTKMQTELQQKSEAFEKDAAGMPEVILAQRQQELQQMDANVRNFYQSAQQDMKKQQQTLTQPIIEKAVKAIEAVGKENGFTYIFDTAKGEIVYKSLQSIDVTTLVKKKLGLL